MRILAVSSTRGDRQTLHHMVLSQLRAEVVIHLRDGCDDMRDEHPVHPEETFLQVRGNHDWGSALPLLGEVQLEDHKIFYTHGNLYNTKYTLDEIGPAARLQKATTLLLGHAYVPYTEYDNRLYVMNPGPLHGADVNYGIVDLTPRGMATNVIRTNQGGKELEIQRPKGFSYGWVRCQARRLVSH